MGTSNGITKLLPFQQEDVKRIYGFKGRAILGSEMGLGKTIQALYWITKIPKHRPVVVVTPASVKYMWQAEALLHFNLHTMVLDGHYKKGRELPGDIII